MKLIDVKKYFKKKKDEPCPITEKLVKGGYQQAKGTGYMKVAEERGEEINYKKALPSQYWHLIESYCIPKINKDPNAYWGRVTCGELLVWMAEVSNSVDKKQLESLVDEILESKKPPKKSSKTPFEFNRRKWNREIEKMCVKKIKEEVLKHK